MTSVDNNQTLTVHNSWVIFLGTDMQIFFVQFEIPVHHDDQIPVAAIVVDLQ